MDRHIFVKFDFSKFFEICYWKIIVNYSNGGKNMRMQYNDDTILSAHSNLCINSRLHRRKTVLQKKNFNYNLGFKDVFVFWADSRNSNSYSPCKNIVESLIAKIKMKHFNWRETEEFRSWFNPNHCNKNFVEVYNFNLK